MKPSQIPRGTYFVSYAYAEQDVCERLQRTLPAHVKARTFPVVDPRPGQFASDAMLDAIAASDGVITLTGPLSENSPWVAFERDYALRLGKPVVYYDHRTDTFDVNTGDALDLRALPIYAYADRRQAEQVITYLREARRFDVWPRRPPMFEPVPTSGSTTVLAMKEWPDRNHPNAVRLLFWSSNASGDPGVHFHLGASRSPIVAAQVSRVAPDLRATPIDAFINIAPDGGIDSREVDNLMVALLWAVLHR